jgi:hypothetical protein
VSITANGFPDPLNTTIHLPTWVEAPSLAAQHFAVLLSSREVERHVGGLIQSYAYPSKFGLSSYIPTGEQCRNARAPRVRQPGLDCPRARSSPVGANLSLHPLKVTTLNCDGLGHFAHDTCGGHWRSNLSTARKSIDQGRAVRHHC